MTISNEVIEHLIDERCFNDAHVACPACACIDDDQYTCTTCWCTGGNGIIDVTDIIEILLKRSQGGSK